MRPPSGARLLAAVLSILCFAYGPVEAQTVGPAYPTPPSIAYGELYRDVELASIFPDSKTFPDMIPGTTPSRSSTSIAQLRGRQASTSPPLSKSISQGRHPRARP